MSLFFILIFFISLIIFLILFLWFTNSNTQKKTITQLNQLIKDLNESLERKINNLIIYHDQNFNQIAGNYQQNLTNLKNDISLNLINIQKDNEQKLNKIQNLVTEKLEATLEKRVSSSFQLVNERLEQVYKGLGEMQTLAAGVGDLKKVLTNVKTRGVWGEIQLERILNQILNEKQFVKNFAPKKNSQERVEFALKIPQKSDKQKFVYLPIDAKFPLADYENLIDAMDSNNENDIKIYRKKLESRVLIEAKSIADKYLNPPLTTDFAILYLPNESLYLEILKNQGLMEKIQFEHQVMLIGPNNIIALLNTIELSFRAFAIEERSKEIWQVLNFVIKEFDQFGSLLDKTQKKISEGLLNLEKANNKTTQLKSKLNHAYFLPANNKKIP